MPRTFLQVGIQYWNSSEKLFKAIYIKGQLGIWLVVKQTIWKNAN